jgi:hypothetical protein
MENRLFSPNSSPILVLSFSRQSEIACRVFPTAMSVDGDVHLTFPVKSIDKTFTHELIYDAIIGDGVD